MGPPPVAGGTMYKGFLKHVFSYTFNGAFFMLIMALPGVNLFWIPVAVIYFTLLLVEKNPKLADLSVAGHPVKALQAIQGLLHQNPTGIPW